MAIAPNNYRLPVSPLTHISTSNFNSDNQNSTARWSYDAAGNVIADPGPPTYAYDAENRQIYYCSGAGNGKRV